MVLYYIALLIFFMSKEECFGVITKVTVLSTELPEMTEMFYVLSNTVAITHLSIEMWLVKLRN